MNLTLWIIAGLLAIIYLASGIGKILIPREKMVNITHAAEWELDFNPGTIKAIGFLEILAALGLILPAVLDIAPILVPLAALGRVGIMAGAAYTRLRRGEPKLMMIDMAYLALAAFVAWGRFGPESFTA